jgi:hypothetical protein
MRASMRSGIAGVNQRKRGKRGRRKTEDKRTPPVDPLANNAQTGSCSPYLALNFRFENSYAICQVRVSLKKSDKSR